MLTFAFLFLSPTKALAASRYWVGSAGGNTNDIANWSAAQNSCGVGGGASVPSTTDTAFFTSSCTNGATVNAAFTPQGINIQAGYIGTISQGAGVSISVGSANYTQSDGTFTGSDGAITITGSYSLSTGIFTSTSGTLSLGGSLTITSGTFNANGGTLTLNTSAASTLACNSAVFNVVNISKASNSTDVIIGSNCTFPIAGTDPASTGEIINSGTINVTGNWTIEGHYTSNTGAVLTMTGTSLTLTANLTLTAGTFPVGITNLTVGGNLTNTGNLLPNGTALTLNTSANSTYNCGTATFSSVSISKAFNFTDVTVGSNCTFPIAGTDPASTGEIINNGTINVTGNWTLTGYYTSNTGAVLTMTGTSLTITANLTLTAGTFPAGITTLTIGGNLTNTGNLLPNGTVLTLNTSANGTYDCGTATFSSVSISKSLSGNDVIIGSNCTFSIPGTDPASTGEITNNGIINVTGNWTLTGSYTSNSGAVLTMTGTSLNLTGSLTLTAGTFPAGITSLTVSGGLDNSGNLLPSNITLSLTGSGDGTIICGSAVYASITLSKPTITSDTTPGSNCTMGDFTMGGGGDFLNPASPYTYTITGNFVQSGVAAAAGSNLTLKLAGSGTQLLSQTANTLVTPLQIDNTGIVQLATDIRSATTCSVLSGTLFMNGRALNCSGGTTVSDGATLQLLGNDYVVPTLNAGSIVKMVGDGDSSADTYPLPNWSFSNLNISMTDSADSVTPNDTLDTNLAGYWKMDEGSGSTVDDSSSGNNIGNITNATFSATVPTTVFSNPYSLSFDGAGDYLNIGDSSPLGQNKSEISVTAWIRLNNVSGSKDIFGLSTGADNTDDRVNMQMNADELKCQGRAGDAEATQAVATSAANLSATTWYHVACTIDYANDSIKVYINGFEFPATGTVGFTATATSDTASLTSAIGIDQDKAGNDFSGFIDDVRFYNRVLSKHEIGVLTNGYDSTAVITTTIGNTFTQTLGGFTAPATMNVAGNFVHSGGTFTHNSGTVVLNGTDQAISGTTIFNNLTKNVSTQMTLTFPVGVTQTILGTTSLKGILGNILYLVSSSPTNQWSFDPQGTRDIEYINVTDSNNINGTTIAVTGNNIANGGNNTGWDFDTTPPTVPGTPSTTTPTNDTTPTWTWTASTDAGVGLATPPYTLEWSTDSSFLSGVSSSTSATNSFTHSSALSEDTWYFRVKAADTNGNESSFSSNGSVVVDTTNPSTPGVPSTTTPTNSLSQTWSWTAATDALSGVGSYAWRVIDSLSNAVIDSTTVATSVLTNLTEGVYTFFVKTIDNAGNESAETSGSVTVDTTDPTISAVVSTPSSDGTTITWTTNHNSSSRIDYGLTNSYGNSTSETDTAPRVQSHSGIISGLVSCTTYHYRVKSKDTANNEGVGSDNTFTTTGCTGSATVDSQTASAITIASGGSIDLIADSKGITLEVPTSFAGSDANFQIKKLDEIPVINTTSTPTGYSLVDAYVYDLKALTDVSTSVPTFSSAITVSITYVSGDISGIDESSLVIYRWNGSAWQALSNCLVNTGSKTVTCTTTSFSVFGLFGTPSASSSTTTSDDDDDDDDDDDNDGCRDDIGIQPPWLYGAVAKDSSSILLYFTEAADPVDRYGLKYGIKSNDYIYDIENLGIKSESKMTYLVKDLKPNTAYYFKVRGGSGCARGDWSNEISTTTKPLKSSNNLQFIDSKLEAVPLDIIDEAVVEPDKEPIIEGPESESEEKVETEEGYTVKVKVLNDENVPVEGAKVTIHSKVQEAVTDKDGLAVFENVEKGDHRVIIAYSGFEGEQALNLVGDVKEFSLEIKIKPQNVMASPIYLWSVGILSSITLLLIGLLFRKKNKS